MDGESGTRQTQTIPNELQTRRIGETESQTTQVTIDQKLWQAIAHGLPKLRRNIIDLQGGDGLGCATMATEDTRNILIADAETTHHVKVNRDKFNPLNWHRIRCGLAELYPLLRETRWKGDLFVCHGEGMIDMDAFAPLSQSALHTVRRAFDAANELPDVIANWMAALDCSDTYAAGVVIMPHALYTKHVELGAFRILLDHVWMRFDLAADIRGTQRLMILYWSNQHLTGSLGNHEVRTPEALAELAKRQRHQATYNSYALFPATSVKDYNGAWDAVRDELLQLRKPEGRKDFNIWIEKNGRLRTRVYKHQELSSQYPADAIQNLLTLDGKLPNDLVIQFHTRTTLTQAVSNPMWRCAEGVQEAVNRALVNYDGIRATLYPLKPAQCLGYLDEQKTIRCNKSFDGFTAGVEYPVNAYSVTFERLKFKPNAAGTNDEILLNGKEQMLAIRNDQKEWRTFVDQRHLNPKTKIERVSGGVMEYGLPVGRFTPDHPLQSIIEHFEVRRPKDVAEANPEQHAIYLRQLAEVSDYIFARCGLRPKKIQVEDIARSLHHDGLVPAWDCGAGKSWFLFIWTLLKVNDGKINGFKPIKPVLIVTPEHLHDQLIAEANEKFGAEIMRLDSKESYRKQAPLKPGWYLTSYSQLTQNGVETIPHPDKVKPEFTSIGRLMHQLGITVEEAKEFDCSSVDPELMDGLGLAQDKPHSLLDKAIAICRVRHAEFSREVGSYQNGIKCVYSPSLGDECGHEFEAVCIDEGTRIKSRDSITGMGVRQLDPRFRLVLTGTPIKNRLKDIFWLLWWAAGGFAKDHARFPYSGEPASHEQFSREFHVCERNLTVESIKKLKTVQQLLEQTGKKPRGLPGNEVCNVHKIWKVIAPIVLRRRLTDMSDEIVKMRQMIVRVPMGTAQREAYHHHLHVEPYLDRNDADCMLSRLQALRSVAAAPDSRLLSVRSDQEYIPKVAAALEIIRECMLRGEQCVVFSALQEPLHVLGRRLNQAGVPFDILDGDIPAGKRGQLATMFKRGLPNAKPVMLAGLKAMGEGWSFSKCNNVILIAFDWAWDLFDQAIKRVYRLDSIKDVNIWSIVADGTIDLRLDALRQEKGESTELVLDGELMGEQAEEVDIRELLKLAYEEFKNATVFDEQQLEQDWPRLKLKLGDAYEFCRSGGSKSSIYSDNEPGPEFIENIQRLINT